ncbi:hypothetical protein L7F22_031553 [Adiantum nelumboides]|nr:hypothetical protein [Adiantum nelumboides]
MYAKCGALGKAQEVLAALSFHDVVLWNALIGGYAKQGLGTEALDSFNIMQHKGISPNAVTFTCILNACGTTRAMDIGKQIHENIAKEGLLKNNVVLGTALVDMYAKCGALAKAQEVLEDLPSRSVVSWSALIAGYAQHGQGEQALSCFDQMQYEGISPDRVTFISILKACGSIKAFDKGSHIYNRIIQLGLLKSDVMLGTAVVDMYVKCCALAKAREVLEVLPFRNVVSWNTLITGYAQQSQGEEALDCFARMQCDRILPDAATYACILKVYGSLNALDKGELMHDEIVRQRLLENDVVLGTALVDMYVKCGALVKARKALKLLVSRNVVSWNTLIAGYAQQGQAEEALYLYKQMQLEGISPDAATFSSVLTSCSHLGLVEDGYAYFTSMSEKFDLKPQLEHFSCMVDLYGRAGHLDKAARVIQQLPCTDDSFILSALLAACQKWGDVKVGKWAFQEAVRVDKSEGGAYVLMANLHAAADIQADAENVEAVSLQI